MASVLSVAVKGESKTHIMFKCNLSFRQVQSYLRLLVDRGLLKVESKEGGSGDIEIFVTTSRGRGFLKAYRNLKVAAGEGKV
jgi:predicted transcriptional regulator